MDAIVYFVAYTSLLLTPLPNANSRQIPALDYNRPFHISDTKAVNSDIKTKSNLYKCYPVIKHPCDYNNNWRITRSRSLIYFTD